MLSKSSILAVLSAAAVPALAELAVTEPIASTVCRGGERCRIAWNDNRRGVSLEDQGNSTVALYTGSVAQQTFLQPIVFPETINVATTGSIEFTVDPSIGESGRYYFIRFVSEELRNPASPAQPYLSFSAIFTLEGMQGTFNSTVKAQIDGAASTPGPSRTLTNTQETTLSRTTTTRLTVSSPSVTSTDDDDDSGSLSSFMGMKQIAASVAGMASIALFGLFL